MSGVLKLAFKQINLEGNSQSMSKTFIPPQTQLTVSTANVDSYIATAYQIPVLDADQEHALALRLHEDNDLDAARTLILHHLRFVVQVARGYNGYGLPVADLIQEGNVGLMKAVKKI